MAKKKSDFEARFFDPRGVSKSRKQESGFKKQLESGEVSGITAQRLQERLDTSGLGAGGRAFAALKSESVSDIEGVIAEDIRDDEEEEGGKGLSRKTLLGI